MKNCSKESMLNELCLLCNDGYYPIYNENIDNT